MVYHVSFEKARQMVDSKKPLLVRAWDYAELDFVEIPAEKWPLLAGRETMNVRFCDEADVIWFELTADLRSILGM